MPREIQPAPEQQQVISYPTPQLLDSHLIDRVDINLAKNQTPLEYGSPHPNTADFSGYTLIYQAPIDPVNPNWIYRYWINGRNAQNTYNFGTTYDADSNACPVFERVLLLERSSYAPQTKLVPLQGIYRIDVTAGGSGYENGKVAISFTGGTGSGATAIAVTSATKNNPGAITHIIVTAGGSYTEAPTGVVITSTSSPAGTGATAVAYVQPQTALLVYEDQDRAGVEMDSLWVKVKRIFHTLPGGKVRTIKARPGGSSYESEVRNKVLPSTVPTNVSLSNGQLTSVVQGISTTMAELIETMITNSAGTIIPDPGVNWSWDLEFGGRTIGITVKLKGAYSDQLPTLNTSGSTGLRLANPVDYDNPTWETADSHVIRTRKRMEGDVLWTYITYSPLPNPWAEYVSMAFQFPAILNLQAGLLTDYQGNTQPPWLLSDLSDANGYVAFNGRSHLTIRKRGKRIHYYTLGPVDDAYVEYRLITTANMTQVLRGLVGENTYHGAYSVEDIYVNSGGTTVTQIVESVQNAQIHGRLNKSIDTPYSTTDICVVSDDQRVHEDTLVFERVVDLISEDTKIEDFPI